MRDQKDPLQIGAFSHHTHQVGTFGPIVKEQVPKHLRTGCDDAEIDARRERAYLPPWDTPPQRGASIWKDRLT
jgi:hypothetical protein